MSYIVPNSTIKLGQSALQYGSEDTMYWANKTAQMNGIFAEVVTTFPRCTYQRDRRGYVRVEGNAEAYDYCNYMAFQNTNYMLDPSKWFYCFVLDIEYINNDTMEIHYEIDYIQTYYFDYHEESCFVERCHSLTDNIGDNILPEGIDIGEYVYNENNTVADLTDTDVIFLTADDSSTARPLGDVLDNMFVGLQVSMYRCNNTNLQALRDFIDEYTSHPNTIVAAYIVPHFISTYYVGEQVIQAAIQSKDTVVKTFDMPGIQDNYQIDGYTPKNKKLYTYPYCFYEVTDGNGNNINMRYEFMNNPNSPRLGAYVTITPPATIVFKPLNYKNTGYVEQTLTITGFPLVGWAYDAFKTWLSTSLVPNLVKSGATALGAAVGYKMGIADLLKSAPMVPITPDPLGIKGPDLTNVDKFKSKTAQIGAAAAGVQVGSLLADGYSAAISGGISQGNYSNNGSLIPLGLSRIMGTRVSISRQHAKVIDDFFTMYGYAHKALIPMSESKRHRRTRFTYIKTVGCTIIGELPQDARLAISELYNRGLRFWADHTNMYDYSYDNLPLP